jgi:hypothetical protein
MPQGTGAALLDVDPGLEDEPGGVRSGGSAMPQLNPQMAEILALNAAAMKDRPAP